MFINRINRAINVLVAFVLLSSCCVCFLPSMNVAAYNDEQLYDDKLNSELSIVEKNKDLYGLNDVDFSKLITSDRIPIYEVKNKNLNGRKDCMPIYYNNVLRMIAFNSDSGEYQIYAIPRNSNILFGTEIAFLVNDTGMVVYDGKRTKEVFSNAQSDKSVNLEKELSLKSRSVKLSRVSKYKRISFSVSGTKSIEYRCYVEPVLQTPYDNICWAACTAMVKNYYAHLSGNNKLTAVEVARRRWPNCNFNQTLSLSELEKLLRNTYKLDYNYKTIIPQSSVMIFNIRYGNPMIGAFYRNYDNKNHVVCIYGINNTTNKILIIDPLYGCTTAMPSGKTYKYIDCKSYTLTMYGALCRSWGTW